MRCCELSSKDNLSSSSGSTTWGHVAPLLKLEGNNFAYCWGPGSCDGLLEELVGNLAIPVRDAAHLGTRWDMASKLQTSEAAWRIERVGRGGEQKLSSCPSSEVREEKEGPGKDSRGSRP